MSGRLPPAFAWPRKIAVPPYAGNAQMCENGTPVPDEDDVSIAQPLIAKVCATVALLAGTSTDACTPLTTVTFTLCDWLNVPVTVERANTTIWYVPAVRFA